MIKSMLGVVLLCLVGIMLTSCGTKGPLYIPEQRYPQGAENNSAPKAATQHILQVSIRAPYRASL